MYLVALALAALAATNEATVSPEKAESYRAAVHACLDNLLDHGTDRYGEVQTPMIMSIIDIRSETSPEEPEVQDGLVRAEGRLHRRNPRGADLWDDQPLLRTMYTYSELSGDRRYAEAADAYTKAYFERSKKPNGLLAWGTHIFYDAYKDAPGGDQDGAGPHEMLLLCPNWDRMWAVNPDAVRNEIELIWEWHIVDKRTGLHNRHDDKQPGCDFAFSGGEFGYAFAWIYAKTHDEKYLEWSKTAFGRHWRTRNRKTNLAPDAPGTGARYDAHHCFTTLPGPHASLLLKAYEATGDGWFKDVALEHIQAYLKYGWDAEAQQYWGMLQLDGTPVLDMDKADEGYDVWKPTGHVDIWRAIMFSYEFPVIAAQTAVYAYDVTKDPQALESAQHWATAIRAQMPPSNGRRWAKEVAEALPDAVKTGGTYAENYGRAISFFLSLYRAAGNPEDFATAVALADEAMDKCYQDGWFKGHPAKPYYESTDGVAYLMYALLELAEYPKPLGVNL